MEINFTSSYLNFNDFLFLFQIAKPKQLFHFTQSLSIHWKFCHLSYMGFLLRNNNEWIEWNETKLDHDWREFIGIFFMAAPLPFILLSFFISDLSDSLIGCKKVYSVTLGISIVFVFMFVLFRSHKKLNVSIYAKIYFTSNVTIDITNSTNQFIWPEPTVYIAVNTICIRMEIFLENPYKMEIIF